MKFIFLFIWQLVYLYICQEKNKYDEPIGIDDFNNLILNAEDLMYPDVLNNNVDLSKFDHLSKKNDFLQQQKKQMGSQRQNDSLVTETGEVKPIPQVQYSLFDVNNVTMEKLDTLLIQPRKNKEKNLVHRILLFGPSLINIQHTIRDIIEQQQWLSNEVEASDLIIKFNNFDPIGDNFNMKNVFKQSAEQSVRSRNTFVLIINNIERVFSFAYDNDDIQLKLYDWFFDELRTHAPSKPSPNNFMESFSDLVVVMTSTQPQIINDILVTQLDSQGVFFDYPDLKFTKNYFAQVILNFEKRFLKQQLKEEVVKSPLNVQIDQSDEIESKLDYLLDYEYSELENPLLFAEQLKHEKLSENDYLNKIQTEQSQINDIEDDISKNLEKFQKSIVSFIQTDNYVSLEANEIDKEQKYMKSRCPEIIQNDNTQIQTPIPGVRILIEKNSDITNNTQFNRGTEVKRLKGVHSCVDFDLNFDTILSKNFLKTFDNKKQFYVKDGLIQEDIQQLIQNIITREIRKNDFQLEINPKLLDNYIYINNDKIIEELSILRKANGFGNTLYSWGIQHKFIQKVGKVLDINELPDIDLGREMRQFIAQYLSYKMPNLNYLPNLLGDNQNATNSTKYQDILTTFQEIKQRKELIRSDQFEIFDIRQQNSKDKKVLLPNNTSKMMNINRRVLKVLLKQLQQHHFVKAQSRVQGTLQNMKQSLQNITSIKDQVNKTVLINNYIQAIKLYKEEIIQSFNLTDRLNSTNHSENISMNGINFTNGSQFIINSTLLRPTAQKKFQLNDNETNFKNQILLFMNDQEQNNSTKNETNNKNGNGTNGNSNIGDDMFDRLLRLGIVKDKKEFKGLTSSQLIEKIDQIKTKQAELKSNAKGQAFIQPLQGLTNSKFRGPGVISTSGLGNFANMIH